MRKNSFMIAAGMLFFVMVLTPTYANAPFVTTIVDSQVTSGPAISVALNPYNQPVIIYRSAADNALRLALIADNLYRIETIPQTGGASNAALAVNTLGDYNLIYGVNTLFAADKPQGASWQYLTIQAGLNFAPMYDCLALCLSSGDLPHIAYVSSGQLYYGTYEPQRNCWSYMPLALASVTQPNIVLDAAQRPVFGALNTTAKQFYVWRKTTLGCEELPAFSAHAAALAYNHAGNQLAVFYILDHQLYYRCFIEGLGWSEALALIGTAEGSISSYHLDAAFDAAGQAHVVFFQDNALRWASSRGLWTPVTIEDNLTVISSRFFALALDAANQPYIAYYNSTPEAGVHVKLAAFGLAAPDRADYNLDGIVNLRDYSTFYSAYLNLTVSAYSADLNNDDANTLADVVTFASLWLWQREYIFVE